jgi:hypothetical protein
VAESRSEALVENKCLGKRQRSPAHEFDQKIWHAEIVVHQHSLKKLIGTYEQPAGEYDFIKYTSIGFDSAFCTNF